MDEQISPYDLGDLGEEHFAYLCKKHLKRANPASPRKDISGWDFLVTYTGDEGLDATFCAQVKTKGAPWGEEKISVSNWRRMVTSPLPWFVIFIEYDKIKKTETRYSLFHIDKTYFSSVLKRCRESNPKPIHKRIKKLHPKNGVIFSEPGAMFKQILANIGCYSDYCREKLREARRVGYRENIVVDTDTHDLNDDEYHELLVQSALGLSVVPVKEAHKAADYFGAPNREVIKGEGSQHLQVPPIASATLSLSSRRGVPRVSVSGVLFSSINVFPFVPERYHKFRFESSRIEFIGNNEHGSISVLPISDGEQIPVEEMDKIVRLSRVLVSDRTVVGEIESPDLDLKLPVSFETSGVDNSTTVRFAELHSNLDMLQTILRTFDASPVRCSISVSKLESAEAKTSLSIYHSLVTTGHYCGELLPRASFELPQPVPGSYRNAVFIWPFTFQVENGKIVFYCRIMGRIQTAETNGEKYTVIVEKPSVTLVAQHFVSPTTNAVIERLVREDAEKTIAEIREATDTFHVVTSFEDRLTDE